jgi:hypothetical protein
MTKLMESSFSSDENFEEMTNDPQSLGGLSVGGEVALEIPFGHDIMTTVEIDEFPEHPFMTYPTLTFGVRGPYCVDDDETT